MKKMWNWVKSFIVPPQTERLDVTRRGVIGSVAAGVTGGLLLRLQPEAEGEIYDPDLIRPPGSVEEKEFLARCIRCGACMKVCLTGVIQPAGTEFGTESAWTPYLDMDASYCQHDCTLCGQVCPTDAIEELTLEEKKVIKIGQAFFDTNRCLPYAFDRSCIVCEEHCPVGDKAIWTKNVEVTKRDGTKATLKQPYVDPDLCVGCGICQWVCPITDTPGIYVTSVGESRNPDNQLFLDTQSGGLGGGGLGADPAAAQSGGDAYSSPY